MGGDSDTIAAMAGSIAYAYYEKCHKLSLTKYGMFFQRR